MVRKREPREPFNRPWMRIMLIFAGVYNLAWGSAVVLFPNAAFDWLDIARPTYTPIWQCLGMVIGVYGIGYIAAASDPTRHWPIVLVGLLGKIAGPVGFVYYAIRGDFPWSFGWTIVTNDLVWWIPFGLMLIAARARARAHASDGGEAASVRSE